MKLPLAFFCALLLFGVNTAKAQCYEKLLREGDKAFRENNFKEAVEIWQDAKKCSDCPKPAAAADKKISEAKAKMAKSAQKPANLPQPGSDTSHKKITLHDVLTDIQMIEVKGSQFTMGSENGNPNEQPSHVAQVADFYISKYEVTQTLWRRVMGTDPANMVPKGCGNCPVESATWKEVQDFLLKIRELTGVAYRLPTEAEWEYAARGGGQSRGYKYAGSNDRNEVAKDVTDETYPVGQKKPNELGICDMSGNVWEMTADCWHSNYTGAPADSRPWAAERCKQYVIRGGSWYDHDRCHVTSRNFNYYDNTSSAIGFRLAKD